MRALSYLARSPKRSRALFVLTPLIDVMFLLLIFFMLSSQIAPFSLIPTERAVRAAPTPAGGTAAASSLALRVGAGTVGVGGETRAITELKALLPALEAQGFTGVVVSAAPGASVQDVVSVLEAVSGAGLASVTLVDTAP